MTLSLRALPLLAALALAACEATATGGSAPSAGGETPPLGDMLAPVLPNPAQDTCGGSGLTSYIGQPASMIDAARFANPIRVIPAGSAVTMDFNAQRLNFELDELGQIERVRCG